MRDWTRILNWSVDKVMLGGGVFVALEDEEGEPLESVVIETGNY